MPGAMSGTTRVGGRRWRRVRDACLLGATACRLCHHAACPDARGERTDRRCPGRYTPDSADHIVPIELGGAEYDPANVQPAHLCCNIARHAGALPVPRMGTPTRDW
jgi:hypothetical protein